MTDTEHRTKGPREEAKKSEKLDDLDVLVANSVFPDAAAVFTSRAIPLADAKGTATIVLDTNALLVPYGIGPQTLSQIESTYRQLLNENRLIIPAQVAREFARNRVTKLSELHQKLTRRRSQLQSFQQGNYPLLEHLEEYKRLRDVEGKLDGLASEYKKLMESVLDHVKSWEWNDPVSALYSKIFAAPVVLEASKSADELKREHARRFAHKIPPGYKDESKDDGGIGDFLIWQVILEVGAARKTSLIFVSGEEKGDWWHKSEGQPLYPRFELVDEYRRASAGKSFHIIKFSDLLQLFGASKEIVAEVRHEESLTANVAPDSEDASAAIKGMQAERAVADWLGTQDYSVQAAPVGSGFDFLVESPRGKLAIDVAYMTSREGLSHRLRVRRVWMRSRQNRNPMMSDVQLALVVVSDSPAILASVERVWSRISDSFRLCTGLLMPGGKFQVRKNLE